MMRIDRGVSRLACALLVVAACTEEKEATKPAKPEEKIVEKAPAKPPEPVKPAKLTSAEQLKRLEDCSTGYATKDVAKITSCYADDATAGIIDSGQTFTGGKAIVEGFDQPMWAAFPDMTVSTEMALVNDTQIAVTKLIKGTNTGPFMGMAPTGKKVGFYDLALFTMADDGKIKSVTHYCDMATTAGQLGMSKAPVRPVVEQGSIEKPTVIATDSKTESENVALVRQALEAFNKHDMVALTAMLTDDAIMHDMAAPADQAGKKAIEAGLKELFGAFSDMRCTSTALWGAGDYAVNVIETTGTNDGDMKSMGLKKTGKPIRLHAVEVYQIAGGKVKNLWMYSNGMAMATQLGLVPPPSAAPTAPAIAPTAPGVAPHTPAAPGAPKKPQ